MSGILAPHVLVVDDEPGIRIALEANFRRGGWRVETAAGVRAAVELMDRMTFDLVVSDGRMPDGDGFEVLEHLRVVSPGTACILLTAFGSVPQAVRAMQDGAVDYLTKPVPFEQLQAAVDRVIRQRSTSRGRPGDRPSSVMVGRCRGFQGVLERARAAARTDADVLIEAESGTGKELLARLIHETSSRAAGPFVAINCAALPESLLESELFGHARGAFTGAAAAKAGRFEAAHGGTLLLDEIGDMPLNLQPKLLRALQEREVERLGETRPVPFNIRVIATTNVQLSAMVGQGLFRSDLFYRLNVIPLSLPPLRERREDIALLALHFAREMGADPEQLEASFLHRLAQHSWPGNVRELGNFMRRMLSLYPRGPLTASEVERELAGAAGAPEALPANAPDASLAGKRGSPGGLRLVAPPSAAAASGMLLEDFERQHLQRTLELTRGNRTQAAEMLGISLRTVRNKIRQYDLPPRRYA